MNEGTVQGVIGVATHQVNTRLKLTSHDESLLVAAFGTGQVTDRAGDNADRMTALHQAAGQFVVARATGFVQCCKCLVDEKDMHVLLFRKNEMSVEFYIILAGSFKCA